MGKEARGLEETGILAMATDRTAGGARGGVITRDRLPGDKGHGLRNALLGAAAAGILGAGGVGIAVTRGGGEDDSNPANLGAGRIVDKNFPNSYSITDFTPVPKKVIEDIYLSTPRVDIENNKLMLGFIADNETVSSRPDLRSNSFLSAITPGYIDRKDLERRGVTDGKQFTGFNKKDIILSPVEARAILITHSGQQEFGGTEAYTTVRLLFTDQDKNNCGITMSALAGELLVNGIPPAPTDHHPVPEDGVKVGFNQPLFRLTTESQTPKGMGRFYSGQNGQVVIGASCDLGNVFGISLTPTFIPAPGTKGIAISTSA